MHYVDETNKKWVQICPNSTVHVAFCSRVADFSTSQQTATCHKMRKRPFAVASQSRVQREKESHNEIYSMIYMLAWRCIKMTRNKLCFSFAHATNL